MDEQIKEVSSLLSNSSSRDKNLCSTMLATMNREISMARNIVSTLFEGRKIDPGVWKGPLPRPRVSPPLTLGDCRVTDRRGDRSTGRRSPVRSQQCHDGSFLNSKSKRAKSVDRRVQVRVWVGSSWGRFNLNPNVGRVLSRRRKPPDQFRSSPSAPTLAKAAADCPSYADITRCGVMAMEMQDNSI